LYEKGKWQRRGLCDEVRTVLNVLKCRLVALKVNGKDVIEIDSQSLDFVQSQAGASDAWKWKMNRATAAAVAAVMQAHGRVMLLGPKSRLKKVSKS